MRARYYNPYICRFVNADPSGFAGGLNYWFCGTICGSKWRIPAAGRRVRYAWRPAATRAGGSKLVAAARLPAAGMLVASGGNQ